MLLVLEAKLIPRRSDWRRLAFTASGGARLVVEIRSSGRGPSGLGSSVRAGNGRLSRSSIVLPELVEESEELFTSRELSSIDRRSDLIPRPIGCWSSIVVCWRRGDEAKIKDVADRHLKESVDCLLII